MGKQRHKEVSSFAQTYRESKWQRLSRKSVFLSIVLSISQIKKVRHKKTMWPVFINLMNDQMGFQWDSAPSMPVSSLETNKLTEAASRRTTHEGNSRGLCSQSASSQACQRRNPSSTSYRPGCLPAPLAPARAQQRSPALAQDKGTSQPPTEPGTKEKVCCCEPLNLGDGLSLSKSKMVLDTTGMAQ